MREFFLQTNLYSTRHAIYLVNIASSAAHLIAVAGLLFTISELKEATEQNSGSNLLGYGGVYKGILRHITVN